MSSSQHLAGPPYAPTVALSGLTPSNSVDTPICAVLLVLFLAGAATNLTIFRVNRRRDHKFIMSMMQFAFCVFRSLAMVLRIVWANRADDVSVSIAASIFTLAGVIVLFLINLIFSQRIVRAYRPRIGWNKKVTYVFRFFFASIVLVIVMMIPATIDSFYTTSVTAHNQIRKIQLVGSTFYAVLAFLPLPIVFLTIYLPPLPPHHGEVETFGKKGRPITQIRLLVFTATLLTIGAAFRAGINYEPRPRSDPAWYHSKPCYYCFNFVIELIVVYTYTISRFDLRFHIPNGASGPGAYSAGSSESVATALPVSGADAEAGLANSPDDNSLRRKPSVFDRINTETEAFSYEPEPVHSDDSTEEKTKKWDRQARHELLQQEKGEAA